jgi:hypothetical protein
MVTRPSSVAAAVSRDLGNSGNDSRARAQDPRRAPPPPEQLNDSSCRQEQTAEVQELQGFNQARERRHTGDAVTLEQRVAEPFAPASEAV